MTTTTLAQTAAPSVFSLGRTYLHPAFDYLVIGGGLSLVLTIFLAAGGTTNGLYAALSLQLLLLLSNLSHFAASTVRLYTKPGAFVSHRFLTMGFPLVTIAVLTFTLLQADVLGRHLQALYLTWSPFHYAAQAYGLAVMYCYRSGYSLQVAEKRLIRAACLLPFAFAFLDSGDAGIGWLVPPSVFAAHPFLMGVGNTAKLLLAFVTLVGPLVLFGALGWRRRGIPLISLLVIVSNGVWWVTLRFFDAFVWATFFHGLQYLAITLIFHVREQLARPDNQHGWFQHTLRFYGLCVLLGYALFKIWPGAFMVLGFGWAESVLLVGAMINIHHFVVDAFIWRLRRDSNYRVVTGGLPAAA